MKNLLLLVFLLTGHQVGIINYQITGKNMELSRVHQILSGNTRQADNQNRTLQAKQNENPILLAPDQLFNSSSNFKVADKPLPTLDFSSMNSSGTKLINENTRVLHIGDSHTAGIYGTNMDKMMRETGAKVFTLGSSGSSPSSWIDGFVTKSGFYYNETGESKEPTEWEIITNETQKKLDDKEHPMPRWKIPTKTPNINDMIAKFKPNVIIFSLGANLAGYAKNIVSLEKKYTNETNPQEKEKIAGQIKINENVIANETRRICEIAKASGAKIVWVGPPDGRPDIKPTNVQSKLYENIQKVASEYGKFVDSRPYTDYPEGAKGDGVHYWGSQAEAARNWAKSVFDEIQK